MKIFLRTFLPIKADSYAYEKLIRKWTKSVLIEFRCVVTVSTPAVWLARENIERLTPRPCINVEYSHGVVYIEESGSP